MAKFLNCKVTDDAGRRRPEKVFFPDNTIKGVSGQMYHLTWFKNAGNNGTIFECRDEGNNVRAAKFLHMIEPQRRERFNYESLLATDLDHPNIIPCFDTGEAETSLKHHSVPFMITAMYTTNLRRLVDTIGPLGFEAARNYGINLCNAFHHLYERGIVHRDVKPENIFISGDQAVLGDLGLAKTTAESGADRYYRRSLTLDGEVVGPILWMSPELVKYIDDKKHIVDHRSDLFQLGLILWFMVTREIPRGFLDEQDDPTHGPLFAIVRRLLASKPDARFQTSLEVRAALEAINAA